MPTPEERFARAKNTNQMERTLKAYIGRDGSVPRYVVHELARRTKHPLDTGLDLLQFVLDNGGSLTGPRVE